MYQSFTVPTSSDSPSGKLASLRDKMANQGLAGFIIPRADVHQGEYVPPADERLAFISGFTGSAGIAVVLEDKAALFADGRYTLQATKQTDKTLFEIQPLHDMPASDWIVANAATGARIGFDPWLHGKAQIDAFSTTLEKHEGVMVAVESNLVDMIWSDRPAPPAALIRPHALELSGEEAKAKRTRIATLVREAGAESVILTLPDNIAWLFNIRGGDIPRNPVPLCFAILHANGSAVLFLRPDQTDEDLAAHLGPDVRIEARDRFETALEGFGSSAVLLDRQTCPLAIATILERTGTRVIWGQDPCIAPKALKNAVEQQGARDAHLRDGAAMARFLSWLDREAPSGRLTEISIAQRLEEERRATNALRDISFDTISGSGPNGAIVHYRVNETSNRHLVPGELMLVDSGGQYVDGTTDITRTIAVGEPPEGAARAFTLVLKGMIAVSCARFPKGTSGRDLDTMARMALWRAGMDYDHGTGHGIGSYLCVHEGPQSLSRRGHVALEPGMMCSNEPGYYREGAFGIRIENLVIVTPPAVPKGGDRAMMGFETITLAPIDRRLIVKEMLTSEERMWLNAYHAEVRAKIWPQLDDVDGAWLEAACEAI